MKEAYYADYIWYDSGLNNNSWLLTEDGKIIGITNDNSILDQYNKVIFKNSAIFPGLINTHTHLPMSCFRGMADDIPLMTWLNDHIWPAEKKNVSPEFVYNFTMLSIAESIRSGVTCINDMYFHGTSCADAIRDAGTRGIIGFGVMSGPSQAIKAAEAFIADDYVKASLCPHALYTVGPDTITDCAEFARDNNMLLHTHLSETVAEVEIITNKYGKTPAMLMDSTGAFDCNSIFAHCVHLTDEEIDLMGKKNVNVSHCIESNLKLASGFAPIKRLSDAGANITIGTDGAASNNDQSLIGEMSTVSKFHKAFNNDTQVLSAHNVLSMATANAAKALNFNNIGTLTVDNFADFFVLSFDAVHMTPVYDPVSHLVYTAQNNDVTDVYVNGKAVMKDRIIQTFDEEKFKEIARNKAKTIRG